MNLSVNWICFLVLFAWVTSTSAQKDQPRVKIGPDTTYIEGPLTKGGYIDYVAHLNHVFSKGVTPENNAAVLLLKAYPGEFSDQEFLSQYCRALGIDSIPVEGDYYEDFFRYLASQEEKKKKRKLTGSEKSQIFDENEKKYNDAMSKPWKKTDFPEIAAWLDSVKKELAMVRKATLRTHYYHPLLDGGDDADFGGVISILLPQAQSCREFGRTLAIRSMLNLGEGNVEECFEDLSTMRRLGNHIASGATIVEQLVGIAIIGIAQDIERKMALSGKLNAEQLLEYRQKMKQVRAKTNMMRSFGECERFMYLDAVQMVMRKGVSGMNNIFGMSTGVLSANRSQTQMQKLVDQLVTNSTDWSVTMKEGNRIYNKYENILKTDDWKEQDQGLQAMEKELSEMRKAFQGTTAILRGVLGGPEFRGKMMGKIFVSLLLPALNAATTAEKRVQVMDDINYIVFSVAAHRVQNGEFPASIAELKGPVGKDMPVDKYAEGPFRYQQKGKGFLVYSIGPNRRDDQGNGVYNHRHSDGDDLGGGYESFQELSDD